VTAYQSGVNDMVHGGEPLPDSETDPPQRDDIGEEGVPHNVPAHHSTPFILNILQTKYIGLVQKLIVRVY
jgi:hypothetical protein